MHSPSGWIGLCTLAMASGAIHVYAEDALPIAWRNTNGSVAVSANQAEASAALTRGAPRHVVVQFTRMPTSDEQTLMEANGLKLLSYLGGNAFFARTSAESRTASVGKTTDLHSVMETQPGWKLHPMLLRGDVPAYARIPAAASTPAGRLATDTAGQRVAVYVVFHPDIDLTTAGRGAVIRHAGEIRDYLFSINGAVAWLPVSELQAFAMEDCVQWVEPPLPPLETNNDSSRALIQANSLQTAPYHLTGNGIKVLVYDGAAAFAAHPDFGGRLTRRDTTSIDDHPTHVSGTIGGSGWLSGGLYRGMAPGVTIESYGLQYDGTGQFLYTNPGDLEADYDQALNTYGAVIANNSIGTNTAPNGYPCEWEGDYGATDMVIDAMVRGSLGAPMRIIWANGNERGSGRCGSTYHTTAPPACAKNHISVGAVYSANDTMVSFSSWGPSDDGRLKPDVCAPGSQSGADGGVTSTIYNDGAGGYGSMSGTSMAAPAVTGACALILEDYKNLFPAAALPRNSTLKVLLAHYAADLGTVGPDYVFGYGSVRVKDTIDGMRRRSFLEASLGLGQQQVYLVNVPAGATSLKATLAWDDPPGTPNIVPELVNDLDLLAVAPNGRTLHLPWTLDPANPSLPAVRTGEDHRNNIEQVVVDAPMPGAWQILVTGTSVPSGPQVFSLATTPDLRERSSKGEVSLDAPRYLCNSTVSIRVADCDLDGNPQAVETVQVSITSATEPAGELVMLTETAPHSAVFTGSVGLSAANAPGVLQVTDNDTIVATYVDANDGLGHSGVPVTWNAVIDCAGPTFSDFAISAVTSTTAVVTFATSKPAQTTVRYGLACSQQAGAATDAAFATNHSIRLTGLSPGTTYFVTVEALDRAGNVTVDSNGGNCFLLTTAPRQEYWTQQFDGGPAYFDLQNRSLQFTPDGSADFYAVCPDSITSLPENPAASTALDVGDDIYASIHLAGGKTVSLYGRQYAWVHVSPNGYLTFLSGENTFEETLPRHFSQPRVSVLFDDFNPPTGSVKYRQTNDALVVTWENTREYNTTNSNTFQAILYFDGSIVLAWTQVAARDGIVGLSGVSAMPGDFQNTDLSSLPICPETPGKARSPIPFGGPPVSYLVTFSWTPGARATSHNVYLGTAPDALEFKGNQTATTYAPGRLEVLTRYYWRVDEVNAYGTTVGDEWSFSTKSVPPDIDNDGDVDMEDFGIVQTCLSGSSVTQWLPECLPARLDADSDVDDDDLLVFRGCLTGADLPTSTDCMP